MLFLYMEKALERAEYKKLDDGSWFAEIPGFSGVCEKSGVRPSKAPSKLEVCSW